MTGLELGWMVGTPLAVIQVLGVLTPVVFVTADIQVRVSLPPVEASQQR